MSEIIVLIMEYKKILILKPNTRTIKNYLMVQIPTKHNTIMSALAGVSYREMRNTQTAE